MSVLCCHVPQFLYKLACREQPSLTLRPVALLGPDEQVWACSSEASECGIEYGMRPRQAQTRCPDLTLHALDMAACQAAQQGLIGELAALELPVEQAGWGTAYVDLHLVTARKEEIRQLAGELGRRLRERTGASLQPALGWDSGKFTARAAAMQTMPGKMRLVAAENEKRFLAPLPVSLLPLPPATLRQLHWLGIDTLGQFGALPTAAVRQRFGQAGKLAQQWARGQDKRPVQNMAHPVQDPERLEFDPPVSSVPPVLAALTQRLQAQLAGLAAQLQGCAGLSLALHFADGSTRPVELALIDPTTDSARLLQQIEYQLTTLIWPEAMVGVAWVIQRTELPMQQLNLFAEENPATHSLQRLARQLATRHGPIFFEGLLSETEHPVAERRSQLAALA